MNQITINGKTYEECTYEEYMELPRSHSAYFTILLGDGIETEDIYFKLVHPKNTFVFPVRVELTHKSYALIYPNKTVEYFWIGGEPMNAVYIDEMQKVLQEVKIIEDDGGFEK